jgi:hypothetical protein
VRDAFVPWKSNRAEQIVGWFDDEVSHEWILVRAYGSP